MATHHDTDTIVAQRAQEDMAGAVRTHCEDVICGGVALLLDTMLARLDDRAVAKLADVIAALAPEATTIAGSAGGRTPLGIAGYVAAPDGASTGGPCAPADVDDELF